MSIHNGYRFFTVTDHGIHDINFLKAEIGKLSFMPGRFPLTEEEPWRSKGIRRAVVENFLVYFWIDEPQDIVWVTAIVYGRRDRIAALMDMPLQ